MFRERSSSLACSVLDILHSKIYNSIFAIFIISAVSNSVMSLFFFNKICLLSLHSVIIIGFQTDGYTISEGETVGLVVEKVHLFETDIEFEITSGATFIGEGVFSAGGTEAISNISIQFTAPENDITLEDDVIFEMTLSLLTISSLIMETNRVIPVIVQDDDGELFK